MNLLLDYYYLVHCNYGVLDALYDNEKRPIGNTSNFKTSKVLKMCWYFSQSLILGDDNCTVCTLNLLLRMVAGNNIYHIFLVMIYLHTAFLMFPVK